MKPILHIEVGTCTFTTREINKSGIEKAIRNIISALGLELEVKISSTNQPPLLKINGTTCYVAASVVKNVEICIQQMEYHSNAPLAEETYWIYLVREILWHQPQVLCPDELVYTFMPAKLTQTKSRQEKSFLACKAIFLELLNLKIRLPDKPVIEQVANACFTKEDLGFKWFRENLITAALKRKIILHLHPRYFEEVISAHKGENLFSMMRDGLFYEAGIHYPDFIIQTDEEIPYTAYFFEHNAYTSIPEFGLESNHEILVNDTPERLKINGIEGKAVINPGNQRQACITKQSFQTELESQGYTTWDGLGFFILSLSHFLRKEGYVFVDLNFCGKQLDTLKLIYPVTDMMIRKRDLLPLCSKVLRLLAKERLSIRNLNPILEAIIASDFIIADGNQYIIFDERIPVKRADAKDWKDRAENVLEFVRIRMKRYISHTYTAGQSTLLVYLLDPEIEN
jgi:hypothetical protein